MQTDLDPPVAGPGPHGGAEANLRRGEAPARAVQLALPGARRREAALARKNDVIRTVIMMQ